MKMIFMRPALKAMGLLGITLLGACAIKPTPPYDYTAYNAHKPKSIVILPPTNSSPDVKASYSVYSVATRPVAEAGYYVLPVTLVDEAFKANGLQTAADIQNLPPKKLREVFGADAALYLNVKEYGTKYAVVSSVSKVTVEGKLVDLASQAVLWRGEASASDSESQNQNGVGGITGALVGILVKQIIGSVTDASHGVAAVANARLLSVTPGGLLPGPRSPDYVGPK